MAADCVSIDWKRPLKHQMGYRIRRSSNFNWTIVQSCVATQYLAVDRDQ